MRLPSSWQFEAIGTTWNIYTEQPLQREQQQLIVQHIELFDRAFSRFLADSIVSKLARDGGKARFDKRLHADKMFAIYDKLYHGTSGAMTPLVGEGLAAAGYDETYKLHQPTKIVVPVALDTIVEHDANTLSLAEPALLDFGAAGKGHLVDLLAGMLQEQGVQFFTIDASGDIYHQSNEYLTVGLENPLDTTKVIGSTSIRDQAICSSATNRRAWGNFHHVLDGRSGAPTNDIIATWAIADSCMVADALATALFFVSPERAANIQPGGAYIRVTKTGKIEMNKAMESRVKLFV